MFRKSLKSSVIFVGLALLTGLALIDWHPGQLQAASPSTSTLSTLNPPQLVVMKTTVGNPAAGNGDPHRILIGIRKTVQSANNIQNVFQAVNSDSLVITPLGDSLSYTPNCQADTALPGKFVSCLVGPSGPAWGEGSGPLLFVVQMATSEGEVADALVQLWIAPGPPGP